MKFLETLDRLAKAATNRPWEVAGDNRPNMEWNNHIVEYNAHDLAIAFMAHSGTKDNSVHEASAELIVHLANHAEAIAELVRAAEFWVGLGHLQTFKDRQRFRTEIHNALRRLDGEQI